MFLRSQCLSVVTVAALAAALLTAVPSAMAGRIAQDPDRQTAETAEADRWLVLCRKHRQSELETATAACNQALTLYQTLGRSGKQAEVLNIIGHLYLKQGQYESAFVAHQQALELLEGAGRWDSALRYLRQMSVQYQLSRQYETAIALGQRAIGIYQQLGDRHREAKALSTLGHIYYSAKQYNEFFQHYQQSLTIRKEIGDREGQAWILYDLGLKSLRLEQYDRAAEFLHRSVALHLALASRELDPRQKEDRWHNLGERLEEIGEQYLLFKGPPEQARRFRQQALELYQQLGDADKIASTLERLATADFAAGRYDQAQALYQQALKLYPQVRPEAIGTQLSLLGSRYAAAGQLTLALEFKQQALELAQESRDRKQEANALAEVASVLSQFEQPEFDQQGIEAYEQALALYQAANDFLGQKRVSRELGDLYFQRQQYDRAFVLYHQIVAIDRRLGNRSQQARFLRDRLASRYERAGQLERAIATYRQAADIYRKLRDRNETALTFYRLGNSYQAHQQYPQALDSYKHALQLLKTSKVENSDSLPPPLQTSLQDWLLRQSGQVSLELGRDDRALDFFRQNVALYRDRGDRQQQASTAQRIGDLYLQTQRYDTALAFHQQYIDLLQASGSTFQTVAAIDQIGQNYQEHQQYNAALNVYFQALALSTALQQQPDYTAIDLVGTALGNIGSVLAAQAQPELAIVFYKAAINAYEDIRADYQPTELASTADFAALFLAQHEADYRALADLLLQQNRIVEAQRVLDLLKVQELDNYLQNVRGNEDSRQGVSERQPEQHLRQGTQTLFRQEIALGQQLQALEKIPVTARTPSQRQQIRELRQTKQDVVQRFNQFLNSPAVKAQLAQLQQDTRTESFNLQQTVSLQNNLQRLQQDAAILYPLILDDRLELILVTPNAPPIRRTVAVSRATLNQTILAARQSVTDRRHLGVEPLHQLHTWLIEPIASDLAAANIKTLLYAPDGPLRYIPLAALYDGERWLVERFQINNITALSLTEFAPRPRSEPNILAGAFTEGQHQIVVGARDFSFGGLPYAGVELQTIAATVPNTTLRLDQQFGQDFVYEMEDYNIVHLATHAQFVNSDPGDSFILLGNGDYVTLQDVDGWSLNAVDLIVLSACQTGVGDILGNGAEILGFGYQMQRAGARAAIASLWSVDDGGTQALMTAFYQALHQQNLTTAEALQQAQLTLISGNRQVQPQAQRGLGLQADRAVPAAVRSDYSHPYYWAAFFLIGNGL